MYQSILQENYIFTTNNALRILSRTIYLGLLYSMDSIHSFMYTDKYRTQQ